MNDDGVTTAFSKDGDDQLDAAIAELEAALESSDSGRVEDVVQQYPQCESEFRSYLENKAALDDIVAPLAQAASGLIEPPDIPGYRILGLHDEGGMGLIYRAHSDRVNGVVALKVLRDDRPVSKDDRRRFETEARCAFELDHRSIIRVFDIGEVDGQAYYAMEMVSGVSLKEHLAEEGSFESRAAAEIMLEVAEAMATAHRQGVIHRDLKPGNILIDRDSHPRVIDFGLAKRDGHADDVKADSFVGTPFYCSPEQAAYQAHKATSASDVYSLGAVLYEMLTGHPPLQGANLEQTLEKVRNQSPIPLRAVNRAANRSLEIICARCLEKNPQSRYPNAHELAEDLRRALKGHRLSGDGKYPDLIASWMDQMFDEKLSKIGAGLMFFQAIYTACLIGVQVLLLFNWGEPLAWLLSFGSLAVLFTALKTDNSKRGLPNNPSERLLWSIWGGAIFAHLMLAIGMRISMGYVAGFHETFAIMPFITGMAYFITGGSFWKVNIMWGMLWSLLGLVTLTVVPVPWGPSVYIAFSCICTTHMVTAQSLRYQKLNKAEPSSSVTIDI